MGDAETTVINVNAANGCEERKQTSNMVSIIVWQESSIPVFPLWSCHCLGEGGVITPGSTMQLL